MRSRNEFRLPQKRRNDAKRFSNPYFRREEKRDWKMIVLATGIGLAAVCMVAAVFASPFFAVQRVKVTGTETVSPDEIAAHAWAELERRRLLFFRAKNRFLYDEQRLFDALGSAYAFETLDIARTCDLRGNGCGLAVAVREKTSQLLWSSGDRLYLVDLHGIAIRELTPEEVASWKSPDPPPQDPLPDGSLPVSVSIDPLKKLPLFVDLNASTVDVGSTVLTESEVSNLLEFEKRLSAMNVLFSQVDVDRLAGKWMAVKTLAGFNILIDASGDIPAQILNLQVLMRDTIKDTKDLRYIDLRFGDHVYYK